MESLKIVQKAKDDLTTLIEGFIREEVGKLFKRHKNLISFSDEMGVIHFTDNKGDSIDLISQEMNKNWTYDYVLTYKTFKNLYALYTKLDGATLGIVIHRD